MAKVKKKKKSKEEEPKPVKKKTASKKKEEVVVPDSVTAAVTELRQMGVYLRELAVRVEALANGLATEFKGDLKVIALTAEDCQKRYRNNMPTPYGVATAPPNGEIPPPLDGEKWTAKELADPKFTRPILAKLATELGADPKGKMAPDLRTLILQIQAGPAKKVVGECEITGDEDVELTMVLDGKEEVMIGPRVRESLKAGEAQWKDILSGEYEFDDL